MDRRRFLQGAGLSLGSGLVGCAPRVVSDAATAAVVPASGWEAVRRAFPLRSDVVHLAGFFLASHPEPVRAAIEQHRRGLDADPFGYVEDNVGRFEQAARASLARHLGAASDDFAMTDSATMGLGLVYGGLALGPGQEVLTTDHDHPSTQWSLRYHAKRPGGLPVRTIRLYDDSRTVTEEALVAKLVAALRPETRVVALTWVHSASGVKLPIRRIADALAAESEKRGARERVVLAVDIVHGFGVEDVTVADLGADILIGSGHKWLFGPRGTGFVWANAAGWSVVAPTIPTFEIMWRPGARDTLPMGAQMTPGGFHSFEHRWALPAAVDFHMGIGKARIAARVHELNRQCKEGLAAMKHVKLHTPGSDALSAGIVCFDVEGLAPREVVERLKRARIVASESPYAFKCARVSPGLLNSAEDIDAALRVLRAMV